MHSLACKLFGLPKLIDTTNEREKRVGAIFRPVSVLALVVDPLLVSLINQYEGSSIRSNIVRVSHIKAILPPFR
jgi:hypothetical protein